jgi:MFS family permease
MKRKRLNILLSIYLASQAGYYVFAPLYGLFAHNLNISARDIGLIWAIYSLAMALFILIFGKLENRIRKERAIVLGYSIYVLGALSFLLVTNETTLICVLLFNALGAGITLPAYKTLFAKSQDRGKESEEWSWSDAGNMFASAIGAALGGIIVGAFGFSALFITMASIQALAAVIAYTHFHIIGKAPEA